MEFRLLGPVEVWADGRRLPIRGALQRGMLGVLALHANRVVPTPRLVELLWASVPGKVASGKAASGKAASHRLRVQVSQLRQALAHGGGADRLVFHTPGYLLSIHPGELDLERFRRLADQGRQLLAAGDAELASRALCDAVSLWRGQPLEDVEVPGLQQELARLAERRLAAMEDGIEADLRRGRHRELLAELDDLAADQPLRERLCAQRMLALYRSDRRADALAAFRALRARMVEQLGVEPNPSLQRLERQILTADPQLDMPAEPARTTGVGLGVEAPGLVPRQLPATVADFTGRREELGRLEDLLALCDGSGPVVISAIAGTAGVGKTTLAVHFAHQARNQFPDGQLFLNLRGHAPVPPMRPIQALAALLHALGVPAEHLPVDQDQAVGLYRSLLADRRMLMVLDNAYNPEQVRPLLPGTGGCLVVVTSRHRMAGLVAAEGAHCLALDVLSPEEAAALLTGLLGHDRVHAEPDEAIELALLCGFLPLALRIAAANLADQPRQSIAAHVAELRAGACLEALTVDGDEQRAVRAAFDLSYQRMAPDAQRLFRLLGLVPGPRVTTAVAAALTGIVPERSGRLLQRLAGAHLLSQHAPGQYALHDLLRHYAADRARRDDSDHERDRTTRRLFDYYLHTADAAARMLNPTMLRLPLPPTNPRPSPPFSDDTEALAWLDAERPNLVAAIQHAAKDGPYPAAWLLADALRGYYWLRRYTAEWLSVAQAGLAAAEAGGDLHAQAAAQLNLAGVYQCQTQHRQAIEHNTRALALAREGGWLDGQSAALNNLGLVHWQLGQLHEAADHYSRSAVIIRRSQSLTTAEQATRLAWQGVRLGNLGQIYLELGRLEDAAEHFHQALAIDQTTGFRTTEAHDLEHLGEALHKLGRLDDALNHLVRSLALHRETGDRGGQVGTLRLLAEVHRDAGRDTRALELARAALALARDIGDRQYEASTLNTLASIDQRRGDRQAAIDGYRRALRIARETETRCPVVVALIGMAGAHDHPDQPDQALSHAHEALTLAGDAGYRLLEGQAHTALADLHLTAGDTVRAAEHARHAIALQRETGHRLGQARAHVILGRALWNGNGVDAARSQWRAALTLCVSIGVPEVDDVRALLATPPVEPASDRAARAGQRSVRRRAQRG